MDKKQFLHALKTLSFVSEQKPTLPVLSNLLFQTGEDTTYITATDLEVELTYKLPEKLFTEDFLTDANKLLKTINSCPKSDRMPISIQRNRMLNKTILTARKTNVYPTGRR